MSDTINGFNHHMVKINMENQWVALLMLGVSNHLFATEVILTGTGSALTAPDFLELTINIQAQRYDTPQFDQQWITKKLYFTFELE